MRRSAWLLSALAAAALLLLWAMRSEDVPAPPPAPQALQPIAARDLVANPPAAADESQRATIETPEALAPDSLAFTGRCVDDAGHPFAGCRVEVRPLEALHEARSQDCAADGTFRIVVRHAGSEHQLRATGPGCCEVARTFLIEAAATTTAIGDVVLPRGCLLRGRVTSASRSAVAAGDVAVFRMSPTVEPFQPEPLARTGTDADGRFELLVSPGQHRFHVAGFDTVSPAVLSLRPDQREAEVELTVDRQQFAARIAGRVLDADGQPVPGALVTATSDQILCSATSAGDGSFELGLRNAALLDSPVTLQAQHDHFEPSRPIPQAWNTRGADLVLGTAPRCVLQLSLAGQPVTDAAVVLHSRERQIEQQTRLRGPFARGLVPLPPLRSGRCEVVVAPAPATGASVTKVMVQLSQTGRPIVIDLPPLLHRTLRVQHRDGEAIPSARFELFAAFAHVAEVTQGTEPLRWVGHVGDAMLLQSGNSSADGSAVLLGPAGALTVRVTHPACPVAITPDVHLDAAGELVVELQRGGTLRGKLEPADALAGFRAFAGSAAAGPAIRLREEGKNRFWPTATSCPVKADGTFELGGIPSGRWQIRLQCSPRSDTGGRIDEVLDLVEFRGDETEQRLLDATALQPALLTGRITIEGEGRSGIVVQLSVERTGEPMRSFSSRTGANGAFELRGLAGKWTIAAAIGTGAPDGWTQFRWPEPMQLAPGEVRASDFAFARAALMLRCLAPSGAPVTGMQVQVRTPQGNVRAVTPATDAAGRTRAEIDAGTYLLFVLPRTLQEPAALQTWLAARPGKQLADALLPLGSFEVSVGPAVERELRLPEAWEQ